MDAGVDVGTEIVLTAICTRYGPIISLFSGNVCKGGNVTLKVSNGECVTSAAINTSYLLSCEAVSCFSGVSVVNLRDGSTKMVSEVLEGDFVESFDANGSQAYSEVFLIQHKFEDVLRPLRRIEYEIANGSFRGMITISDLHLIRKVKERDIFTAAKELQIGSTLFALLPGAIEPTEARVTSVKWTHTAVRNIHTMNDRIVVDRVMASSLTQIAPYSVLRAALLPMKILYRAGLVGVVARIDSLVHRLDAMYPYAKPERL